MHLRHAHLNSPSCRAAPRLDGVSPRRRAGYTLPGLAYAPRGARLSAGRPADAATVSLGLPTVAPWATPAAGARSEGLTCGPADLGSMAIAPSLSVSEGEDSRASSYMPASSINRAMIPHLLSAWSLRRMFLMWSRTVWAEMDRV